MNGTIVWILLTVADAALAVWGIRWLIRREGQR